MEWASVGEMERDVRESVNNGLRICYGSCCHELQSQEQHRQHALIQKLEKHREQAIEAQNEDQANAAFIYLNIVAALLHHLQLWLLLKADRMEEAWDQLVEAQDYLQRALRFVQDNSLSQWYMELLATEKLLFPPQRFVSSSHYFASVECTICGKVYGECEHVDGYLYMGQMCAKQFIEIVGVDHVAIVDRPRDKGCRWTKVKRDGHMYCTLTLRPLEKADDDRGDAEVKIIRAR